MSTDALLDSLLKKHITWIEDIPHCSHFHAHVDGDLCRLRMNDFPEEPMYTVEVEGEKRDFDELPSGWVIPPIDS
jgi:hypothetical protein